MFKVLVVAALSLFFAGTTTPVESFGLGRPATAGKARSKSSPLADDALSAYPYVTKTDDERARVVETFTELASLYGDEEALAMVKIQPQVLRFNKDYFAPCLDSWEEQFGLESAQAMVSRNPGLLGFRPELTANAEPCMAFSYVIAATRPSLPKVIAFSAALFYLIGENFKNGSFPY
ncbi:hypothetical protein ACHAWF_008384 [Thalassiosira exigua]